MSLSKTTLTAIQNAGQAMHEATVVVSAAVRDQAEHMVNTIATLPFESHAEQAFANFRGLARLSQDLQTLEEQMRGLYTSATELASPAMDVVAALPHVSSKRTAEGKATAEDAVVKPATARRSSKPVKKAKKAKSNAAADKPQSPLSGHLTPNDSQLMEYLKTALNTTDLTGLTGTTMAKGSGLPLGSIGISIKKLIETGAVIRGGRGTYKLPVLTAQE